MKKLFLLIATVSTAIVNAQVCFSIDTNFTQGGDPMGITSADFNNDGLKDLATANYGAGSISILLGTGGGAFGSSLNISLPGYPYAITSEDFNADGSKDLAVTNYLNGAYYILLGNGNGTFGSAITYTTAAMNQLWVISKDFNGDGKLDLAMPLYAQGNLTICLGLGNGTFGPPTNFTANATMPSIVSADLNNDGKLDIAGPNQNSGDISVLLGNGAGSFTYLDTFQVGGMSPSPRCIVAGDFNSDGFTDLATSNYSTSKVSVLLGNGTGNFPTATTFQVGPWPTALTAADFNGDGKLDIATTSDSYGYVSLLLGTGTGSFSSFTTSPPSGTALSSIVNGDLNNDGRTDLAVGVYNASHVSVLLNYPAPTIVVTPLISNICAGSPTVLAASGSTTYSWSTGATTSTISVSPTSTTTYSVSDGFGCSNTATATVNVAPLVAPNICMVTTDSVTQYAYNVIAWDKTLYSGVDSFIVYRYDVMSSIYLRIGAVSQDSLSEFVDTCFNIGGPNGGNPLYSSWRYKLAIKDTCGNISAKSPYHQSMFVQQSGATFSWNAYTVETGQTNPVIGYSFLRDDNNTGAWHVLVNTAGLSTTDPNYSSYPNGNWRVDALGFNCVPTMLQPGNSVNSITSSKSHSNTSKPAGVGIAMHENAVKYAVYPNPSSGSITIQATKKLEAINITNAMGELLLELYTGSTKERIDISMLPVGIYTLQIGGYRQKLIKE